MIKKIIMLLSLLALTTVAVSANDVVLVSDNHADHINALEIANVINGTVITTPWGTYNESVVNEIISLNPDKVIIVGGNLAVVDEYINSLENASLTVERIGGATRYETNANITLRYQNQFANRYENATLCIVNGLDDLSLNETMAQVRDGHCIVLLSNGTNLSVEPERLNLRTRNVEVIENPLHKFNNSGVVNRLRNRGFSVNVQNISEDKAKLMLQHRVQEIEMKIEMLKNQGVNTTTLEQQLNEAKILMNQNRYAEAYSVMLQLNGEEMAATVRLHMGGYGRGNGVMMGKGAIPRGKGNNVNKTSGVMNNNMNRINTTQIHQNQQNQQGIGYKVN